MFKYIIPLLFLSISVSAEFTIDFSGFIDTSTDVNLNLAGVIDDGEVQGGDTFNFLVTLNDNPIDSEVFSDFGEYGGSVIDVKVLINGVEYGTVFGPSYFTFRNVDWGPDRVNIRSGIPLRFLGDHNLLVELVLEDDTQSAYDTDNFHIPELGSYSVAYFNIHTPDQPSTRGTITNITSIPEPDTAILWIVGLVSLIYTRRLKALTN